MIGKNIYVWNIDNPAAIVAGLKAAGIESVILHETRVTLWRKPERIELAKLLKAAGIAVYGGCAVYGDNPTNEGIEAAAICKELNLDLWVFDAESAWDAKPAPDTNAVKLLTAFSGGTSAKSAWCYWAFWRSKSGTSWHPRNKVIWAAQAANYGDCDYLMPMMYWNPGTDAASAVAYLEESWKQYKEATDKPVLPIGRAYNGDGANATQEAITAFYNRARELGADGVSWWVYEQAAKLGLMNTIKALPAYGIVTPEPEPPDPPQPPPTTPDLDAIYAELGALRADVDRLKAWARSYGDD